MRKKKLTTRQKVINRIQRRLKTLEKKDIVIKIKPTKANINEVLKANKMTVNKSTANDVVKDFVESSKMTSRETAKKVKKTFGLSKISDVQKLSGQELHNKIAAAYDSSDEEGDEVLEAYGY